VSFDLPPDWVRVKETRGKALFLIPKKGGKAPVAELGLFPGLLEKSTWIGETGLIDPMKETVTPLEGRGRLKITFTEQSGTDWCRLGTEGPIPYRFWMAEVEAAKPLHFRVGGPAELLDPWRDDFVSFLKSLSAK
jgi:hypothetical protein